MKETHLPPGLQNWTEFGAPAGAPGKVRQNLTLKQHELYGWLLSMHILSAMELVARSMLEGSSLADASVSRASRLPAPITGATEKWSSLLYGSKSNQSSSEWAVGGTACRTAFDPVVSGGLSESILSGTAGEDVDILHPKGAMYYTKGWVLDLEPAERRKKQLMRQWDNLGFVDYKKAYYGVPASGALRLFLPLETIDSTEVAATDGVRFLVLCQSDADGGDHGCDLARDVTYTVGGINASKVEWVYSDVVAYVGKRLCVTVEIPDDAKLVTEKEAVRAAKAARRLRRSQHRQLASRLGLGVEIRVTNERVTWHKGSCSIAHVIWQAKGR